MSNANETLPAMINLFVSTLKQAVSFYLQLSNLKNQFIGSALGIDSIIVSILLLIAVFTNHPSPYTC